MSNTAEVISDTKPEEKPVKKKKIKKKAEDPPKPEPINDENKQPEQPKQETPKPEPKPEPETPKAPVEEKPQKPKKVKKPSEPVVPPAAPPAQVAPQAPQAPLGKPVSDGNVNELTRFWKHFEEVMNVYKDRGSKIEETVNQIESKIKQVAKFCGDYQLCWKVKNFKSSYEAAKSGERSAFLSPQFDSHRNGYKLQLTLCPNGDGKYAGVSMSIFFSIVAGPYDALLNWPFNCPVTITLIDQVDTAQRLPKDVSMTFTPNPNPNNEPFLGKPTGERNMSLGFQKFILLSDLFEGEYLKNDTIYIKVNVDLTNVIAL